MPSQMTAELADLVREQVEDVLRSRGGITFMPEDQERLEKLDAQMSGMLQDRSLGRIMNGPLWLSGASVLNGTVSAEKLVVNTLESITINTGALNVTGNLTAAASYPALTGARVVINSTGVKGFNSSDAETFNLLIDGSGFIGIGTSKVSWSTSGVVTVPTAAISSLTIADIGSGTFNNNFDAGTGRVRAGTSLQRVEITSTGLAAYNTGGTNTFLLSASDGSLTHTGVHTIRNASSGARVELSNVGLRGYNSGGTQTFGFSTSDGSGFLGVSGGGFSWNSSGTVTINGSLLVAGTVTADKLTVSTLSAISANLGTVTAGTITGGTIYASTITTGTMNADRISGGSVGGSFNLGSADLTLSSTGSVKWNSGNSKITSSEIVLYGTSQYSGFRFTNASSNGGSIYADNSGIYFERHVSGLGSSNYITLQLLGATAKLYAPTSGAGVYLDNSAYTAELAVSGYSSVKCSSTDVKVSPDLKVVGDIYPNDQTSRYLTDDGTYLKTSSSLRVTDGVRLGSSSTARIALESSRIYIGGAILDIGANTYGSAGSLAGYFGIYINNYGEYKVPYYNA